jgi:hypothetical protein
MSGKILKRNRITPMILFVVSPIPSILAGPIANSLPELGPVIVLLGAAFSGAIIGLAIFLMGSTLETILKLGVGESGVRYLDTIAENKKIRMVRTIQCVSLIIIGCSASISILIWPIRFYIYPSLLVVIFLHSYFSKKIITKIIKRVIANEASST